MAADKKPYTSTRNLVVGTMKLKDISEVARRQVQFRTWEAITNTVSEHGDSAHDRL